MDAELSALLRSWEWRFVVIAVVMLSGSVYINGFFHIRTLNIFENFFLYFLYL